MLVVMLMLLMLMVMMVLVVFVGQALHLGFQAVLVHGLGYLLAGDLVPGSGDEPGMAVKPLQQLRGGQYFFGGSGVGAAHDDEVGVLHLVVEELAEVSHVHAALARVHQSDLGAYLGPLHTGDGLGHVAELAHAGGLNDYPVGSVVRHHLFKGLGEVPHQGAADAAGVHLGDLHTGVLQKAAVNGYLAELVFNEHQLLALIGLGYQLADKGGLAGPKEAGEYVYLSHGYASMYFISRGYYITFFIFYNRRKGP